MEKIIKAAVDRGASDLHIKAGDVFRARINGDLVALTKQALTPDQTRSIALHLMNNEDDKARLDKHSRLRLLVVRAGDRPLPREHHEAAGIVLDHHARHSVGGPDLREARPAAGAGENRRDGARHGARHRRDGLGKVEHDGGADQLHQHARKPAHSHARESDRVPAPRLQMRRSRSARSGRTRRDFKMGLRAALRQDPDVIMIGEMRDAETVDTAIKAAETGHLLMSTLHTPDAQSTILRIMAMFPPEEQDVIRIRLAESLTAVISQRLLPKRRRQGTRGRRRDHDHYAGDQGPDPRGHAHRRDQGLHRRRAASSTACRRSTSAWRISCTSGEVTFETAKAAASNPSDFELKMTMFSPRLNEP